jgi:hypothetical protein
VYNTPVPFIVYSFICVLLLHSIQSFSKFLHSINVVYTERKRRRSNNKTNKRRKKKTRITNSVIFFLPGIISFISPIFDANCDQLLHNSQKKSGTQMMKCYVIHSVTWIDLWSECLYSKRLR